MKKPIRYVAFLRGINVGGYALIPMAALKAAFAKMGLANARTLLASGNVLFESSEADKKTIAKKIGAGLKRLLNKDIGVMVRSRDDLEKIRSADPFKEIALTPSMRQYVTFLSAPTRPHTNGIPYSSPGGEFRILRATGGEVFSVVDLSKGKGTPEAMAIIEKKFGANVTTRNWNTVLKALSS